MIAALRFGERRFGSILCCSNMADDSASASDQNAAHEGAPRRARGSRKTAAASAAITTGRVQPHSLEAEEYLLSCCLIDGNDTVARCLEGKITAKSFYAPANQVIFDRLVDMYNNGVAIEGGTLAEELKTNRQLEDVGGYAYLTQISGRIPTVAQAPYFIEKVRELYLLRELIKVAANAIEECYTHAGPLESFIDNVEKDIFAVTQDRISDAAQQMSGPTRAAMELITKMAGHKGGLTGVSSGLTSLDKFTYGFQPQEMIILAARPSMGKTSLALNFAEAAALPPPRNDRKSVGVLIFSLEMGSSQLALRLLCSRARVDTKKLRDGLYPPGGEEFSQLHQTADELSKAPIFIDDSSQLTIMELRAKARRLAARLKDTPAPLGFIMVDYLQLLSPTDSRVPREQQVAEASRGLKSLAKELNVPVLVLSQLNRAAEKDERVPRLSDLRESGSIEQDADVVLMLSRPKTADKTFQVAAPEADLIIAKQRNGPVGEIKLRFVSNITRFENHSNQPEP
ncbi:replicative DNA helicase [Ereboglobus sp. PH5-5]|nr:replicative DNA helicase [Ereboglobus sp. PH5-5]